MNAPDADSILELTGRRVAVTGRFAAMTQREICELIEQLGGEIVSSPGRSTNYLVIGAAEPPLGSDGQPTIALKRARHLRACGYAVEIVREDAFLSRTGLIGDSGGIHQRYTVAQLCRILDVSRDQIRRWIRSGLIEPAETVHRLDFFEYQQVTTAKMLCDLVAEGLPLSRIREGLQRVQAWLPNADVSLSQLSVLEENGRMLVRLSDGRLAETSGQLQLEFETDGGSLPVAMDSLPRSTDDWFQDALEYENQGDFRGAVRAYQRAISLDDNDPILHFNLGNVLYASNQLRPAHEEFQRAVQLDGDYVEAWNNLGTVAAELDEPNVAITAFRRAIAVFPLYADAHYNLADVLAHVGDTEQARVHWEKYLELDPKSPWAQDVRDRLSEVPS